jgi:hypothetical protein
MAGRHDVHFRRRQEALCVRFYKDALMTDARLNANDSVPATKRFMGKLSDVANLPSERELNSRFWKYAR